MQAGKDPATGRFTAGNKFGKGNAYSREQARIQAAIASQMSDQELEKFVKSWIQKAKAGKGVFLVSLLERWAGRVAEWSVEERISAMEAELQRIASLDAEIMNGEEEPQVE